MTGKQLRLKGERDLLNVQPFSVQRYENEQLAALTVYSIYWLRQWGLRPTVEAVTVLNHRLFPSRFGMDIFPEFPDANRTLRSLLQCGPSIGVGFRAAIVVDMRSRPADRTC